MNYKLIGQNTLEMGDGFQFIVGLNWSEPIVGARGLFKKIKLSQKVTSTNILIGSCHEHESSLVQVGGVSDKGLVGIPSLASYVCSLVDSNSIVFCQVSETHFWVTCKNEDGSVEITSDRILSLYELYDYVDERHALNESDSALHLINIGGAFEFDNLELRERCVNDASLVSPSDKKALDSFNVRKLNSSFNRNLAGGLLLLIAGLGGSGYLYFTSGGHQDMLDIANGGFSAQFHSDYSSVNKDIAFLKNAARSGVMNQDEFILTSKRQYNEFVMTSPLDAFTPFRNMASMKMDLPVYQKGWRLSAMEFLEGKYRASYSRMYEYPSSGNYTALDSAMTTYPFSYIESIRPLRLLENGRVRVYEMAFNEGINKSYQYFLDEESSFKDAAVMGMSLITDKKKKLDSIKHSIEEIQNSVNELDFFGKNDPLISTNLKQSIAQKVAESESVFNEIKLQVAAIKKIGEFAVPPHLATLLPEGGIEDEIFPILQELPLAEWSTPSAQGSIPEGVEDKSFKGKEYITRIGIDIAFKLPLARASYLLPLLEKEYIFIRRIRVDFQLGQEGEVSFSLVTHEANKDYSLSENKLN